MAASDAIFRALVVLISLFGTVMCQCQYSDMKVDQIQTGKAESTLQYNVTISNNCSCDQMDATLSCPGFKAAVGSKPPENVVSVDKQNRCLLKNGNPIYPLENITFSYGANRKIVFTPLSSTVACS